MLRHLRVRLTALYIIAALALIGLVSGGTYQVIETYFDSTTDLALQHKLAHEFMHRQLPLPVALQAAEQSWSAQQRAGGATPTIRGSVPADVERHAEAEAAEEDFDGALAAIYVLPLTEAGQPVATAGERPPFAPDQAAVAAARSTGSDQRTVRLASGVPVRLLTYRMPSGSDAALVQVGRTLADQERVVARLLTGLVVLDGLAALIVGAGSWWLAGRSLQPVQAAWEQQQTFVANASHELRTPLTLIRASAEVALRGVAHADTDQRALLQDTLDECDHVSRVIDDLLLLSRIDAQSLTLEPAAIPLPSFLADVERRWARVAAARGVALDVATAEGTVWADLTRLRQVVWILLDNALRHTPGGGRIQVRASLQGQCIALIIADTGSGIAPEHLPHLFERFYRAEGDHGAQHSGSGLGLSIAQALVAAQHGQIAVASQPGAGTTVTVSLPAARG